MAKDNKQDLVDVVVAIFDDVSGYEVQRKPPDVTVRIIDYRVEKGNPRNAVWVDRNGHHCSLDEYPEGDGTEINLTNELTLVRGIELGSNSALWRLAELTLEECPWCDHDEWHGQAHKVTCPVMAARREIKASREGENFFVYSVPTIIIEDHEKHDEFFDELGNYPYTNPGDWYVADNDFLVVCEEMHNDADVQTHLATFGVSCLKGGKSV